MKDIVLWLIVFVVATGLLWSGVRSLRTRAWHDGVPALEYMIDHALGETPPPRTTWDRRFSLFQAWMSVLFGTIFSLLGIAMLYATITSE